jgi:DNA-binding NtrC family response regulator
VVEIELPSLRSRPEDIEPLVEHFTAVFNKKHGTKKYFQHKTLDTLKRYPWPGNIRELEGAIERHIILSPEQLIRPEHIESKFYETPPASALGLTLGQFRQATHRSLLDFLENTIELSEGNKAEAARRLGIKGNHLNELLKDTKSKIEAVS